MGLQQYTLHIISLFFGSAALGSLLTLLGTRGKTRAETRKFNAEAGSFMSESFGHLIDALQKQVDFQGDQIKNQNDQINAMQARELELMKIINGHQETERELRKKIGALETKLSKRIGNLENN